MYTPCTHFQTKDHNKYTKNKKPLWCRHIFTVHSVLMNITQKKSPPPTILPRKCRDNRVIQKKNMRKWAQHSHQPNHPADSTYINSANAFCIISDTLFSRRHSLMWSQCAHALRLDAKLAETDYVNSCKKQNGKHDKFIPYVPLQQNQIYNQERSCLIQSSSRNFHNVLYRKKTVTTTTITLPPGTLSHKPPDRKTSQQAQRIIIRNNLVRCQRNMQKLW